MRRWHHGHSVGLGALVALAFLSDHLLWSLTAALLVGLVVGRGWGALGSAMRRLEGALARRRRWTL